MNLQNNNITLGVLLDNPRSKAVLHRQFPTLMRHPLLRAARNMTLAQLLTKAKTKVPPEKIEATLKELRAL